MTDRRTPSEGGIFPSKGGTMTRMVSRPGPVGRGRAGWHQRQLGVVPAERHVTPRGGVLLRPVTGRDGRLVRELKPDGSLLSGLSPVCWLDT